MGTTWLAGLGELILKMILELLLASLLLALVGIFLDLLLGPRSCSNRLRLAGEASRLVGWYVGWLVEWLVGWMDE